MREIDELLDLMTRLRDPELGCPWDRAQSYDSIAPHTIEEAYEVADAIDRGNRADLKDELGDLLFQVVFYTQLAQEEHLFTLADVARSITEKMIRRHPHVFGDTRYASIAEQSRAWERIKEDEHPAETESILDCIPLALPALTRAVKLQHKAARFGFDWSDASSVFAKVEEELKEVRAEFDAASNQEQVKEEIGDLLFACINLARHLGVDPEAAMRRTNAKFERRFRRIETCLAEEHGRHLEQASLAEMDALWERAKAEEKHRKKRRFSRESTVNDKQ